VLSANLKFRLTFPGRFPDAFLTDFFEKFLHFMQALTG
jgi:hypothetical protein